MALSANTVWEVRTTGSDNSGGGFNPSNANFATDLTATAANTSSPVVTSASYTFIAGDVGYYLFVKSGTNWIPGFYPIASVSGGAATLNAAVGAAYLFGGASILNTVAGCATVSSPTSGTWGVDYSYADAARIAYTDLVIGATTTQFTSVANPVGKNLVGNLLNVTGGTGFTVQFVEVVSVATITATCDKSLGTAASTSGIGGLGGGLASVSKLSGTMIAGNKAFIKSGTYTSSTVTIFTAADQNTVSNAPTTLAGYASTRGDITPSSSNQSSRPQVLTTTLNADVIKFNGGGWLITNLVFGPSVVATCGIGITLLGSTNTVQNCKVLNPSSRGIRIQTSNTLIVGCEIGPASVSTALIVADANNNTIIGCWLHDNTNSAGVALLNNATGVFFLGNLITNNAGIAIKFGNTTIVQGNTVYKSSSHGCQISGAPNLSTMIRSNIFAENGGYGLQASAAGNPALYQYDGNAYYSNTSGTRSNIDDVATNSIDGVVPYMNTFDIILTADPFVAKASDDYRLNTTVGGGAACRGHGVPTSWPGNTLTVGYPDAGAVQHQDSGGGLLLNSGMTGGIRG